MHQNDNLGPTQTVSQHADGQVCLVAACFKKGTRLTAYMCGKHMHTYAGLCRKHIHIFENMASFG